MSSELNIQKLFIESLGGLLCLGMAGPKYFNRCPAWPPTLANRPVHVSADLASKDY